MVANELLVAYGIGMITGLLLAWVGFTRRVETGPTAIDLAHESVMQAAFIKATSDVVDDETGREIKERANEVAAEYDLPKPGRWHYDE